MPQRRSPGKSIRNWSSAGSLLERDAHRPSVQLAQTTEMSAAVQVSGSPDATSPAVEPRSRQHVVVLQDDLFQYRVTFFDRLVRDHGIDLTVVHFGTARKPEGVRFAERTAKYFRVGPIATMVGIDDLIDGADVVLAICNPKRLNSLFVSKKSRPYRLILWAHHLGRSAVLARVRRAMIDRADAMVLYDDAYVEEVVRKGVDRDKLFVVPNTIHVPNAQFDDSALRDSFLFVGRLRRRKGIDIFLRDFARVCPSIDRPIFASVVGSGPERARLEQLTERLGIRERVRFTPGTSDPELLFGEFRRALAYVSPLHVGLGVLHSFGYGVPVITLRDRRHAPEVNNCIHNENCYLCDSRFTVSDAMRALASDPATSFEMGRRAFEHYMESRRIDQMADAMARVIDFVSGSENGKREW